MGQRIPAISVARDELADADSFTLLRAIMAVLDEQRNELRHTKEQLVQLQKGMCDGVVKERSMFLLVA